MTIQKQIDLVRDWGREQDIIGINAKATMRSQLSKCREETDELEEAIMTDDHDGITDGVGDTAVTLIMLSELHGVSFEDCLQWAYKEIKDRTGEMVDGTFVKD